MYRNKFCAFSALIYYETKTSIRKYQVKQRELKYCAMNSLYQGYKQQDGEMSKYQGAGKYIRFHLKDQVMFKNIIF